MHEECLGGAIFAFRNGLMLFVMKSCTDSWYILRHNDAFVLTVIASRKNDVYRCDETTAVAVVLPEIDPVSRTRRRLVSMAMRKLVARGKTNHLFR